MTTIQIHEFSTGIIAKGTPENWYFGGVTDSYMNSTLYSIPKAVENAIDEGLLTIPEGQKIQETAFIGREISNGVHEHWSVIAVVTQANDDKGKVFNVYRYFLSQGLGKLKDILRWFIFEAKKANQDKFNPFSTQQIGQPHIYDTQKRPELTDLLKKSEFQNLLDKDKDSITLIIPYQINCVPLIVNELASRKKVGGQLISWVCNVEKLSEPWEFSVIYPASKKSEKRIRNRLKTYPLTSTFNSLRLPSFKSQKYSLPILLISIVISSSLGFFIGRITDNKHQSLVNHLFETVTIPVLNDIVRNYNNFLDVDDVKTAEAIVSILEKNNPNLSLEFLTKYKEDEQTKWIKAIENYQKNANLKPTGIITSNDNTAKRLQCQIQKELKLPNSKEIIGECQKHGITLTNNK